MDEKYYFIYLTTNLINGKKYIGKHYGTLDDGYLGSGKLLQRAVQKYGVHNFHRDILDFSDSEEENCEKEKYYIALFNACENELFYNIHEGGNGGNTIKGMSLEEKIQLSKKFSQRSSGVNNSMYGVKRSKEWKEKHSYWAKYIRDNSVYQTEEYRQHMSEITSGQNNGMYGKHHSEESKQKMSINSKGKTAGAKNGMYGKSGANAINGKSLGMYDDNKQLIRHFACKQEALSFLQLKGHLGLDKALKNKTKYHGYYWIYDQDKSVETISKESRD